jgi:hypothetical protein
MESKGWAAFVDMFRTWATAAKELTPRVMVMFVPYVSATNADGFAEFRKRMSKLCHEQGIEAIDRFPSIEDRFGDDYSQMTATPFDGHPNAAVHDLMAGVL